MKVLHVLAELRPSGVEVLLRSAAPYFRDHGVEGDILATGAVVGDYAPALQAAGFRIHHIPYAPTVRFFTSAARFAKHGGFDVVHLHSERAFIAYVLAARRVGVRNLVRTVHNTFLFDGFLRLRRGVERRFAERLGVRFVAISEGVDRNERSRFGTAPVVIQNWFDSRRFRSPTPPERDQARASLGIAPDEYALVTVGHCSEVKNHGALIEALARFGAVRWRYLHVGREQADQPERSLARQLGVADRITFLGTCDDVRPLLHAADLYVMPSRYEGFGIAAVEALATGLPALLADVPGLGDLRAHLPDLVYCAPEVDAIAAALEPLLAAGSGADTGAARRSQTMHTLFGAAAGARAYCDLYARVAGRQLSPPSDCGAVDA